MKLLILLVLILIGESFCAVFETVNITSFEETSLAPESETDNSMTQPESSTSNRGDDNRVELESHSLKTTTEESSLESRFALEIPTIPAVCPKGQKINMFGKCKPIARK